MTQGSINYSDSEDGSVLRNCPHCQKPIRWKDFTGLATLSWHYPDSIITQAVVSLVDGEELDDHPLSKSEQKCGKCGHVLTETDFH